MLVCLSSFPDIDNTSDEDFAECVCYDPPTSNGGGFVWVPNHFDQPVERCVSLQSSIGNPEAASVYASLNGMCKAIGNLMSATSTDMGNADLATITATSDIGNFFSQGRKCTDSLSLCK